MEAPPLAIVDLAEATLAALDAGAELGDFMAGRVSSISQLH